MAAKDNAWHAFKDEMKRKRQNKTTKDTKRLKKSELIVQRLSAEVSGKAQKFSRIGPREFVPFDPEEDMSLDNIKLACEKHFNISGDLRCDVLAGEQGPSCKTMDQVPNVSKLVHVRFIKCDEEEVYNDIQDTQPAEVNQPRKVRVAKDAAKSMSYAQLKKNPSPVKSQCFPKSLSVLEMLKMGKVLDKKSTTVITLHSFNIELMAWNVVPTTVEFVVEEEPLGIGAFREARKATTTHPQFVYSKWVVKYYLPKAEKDIEEANQSLESHTKKTVQMHMLARNFAIQLEKTMESSVYKTPLKYNKVFFGVTDDNQYVSVEEYVSGDFMKYINNDGISCVEESDVSQKAGCLAHFSYQKSDRKLIILDIQGSDHTLYDPEIATSDLFDQDCEMLFCSGNLSKIAITNFVNDHSCNKYCKSAGLTEL
ncbi:alpha-protein kinase vwkA-like [Dendronephthya gigantea]|uniref:alpha-protein kinase vwkA-like n=1 Tax=Dendronephthya gigantea TaxID=151771 RepID=UPI00106CC5E7|nr:alpha-protein kinase vwkA-like [Dendronephthya gigantea]